MREHVSVSRRHFLGLMGVTGAAGAALGLFGCGQSAQQSASSSSESSASAQSVSASASSAAGGVAIDSAAWSYDAENDVYYQIGLQYCENPQAPAYESMVRSFPVWVERMLSD